MTPDELPADMEARTPAPEGEAWTARHIVFDGPPDHNGPRFIEVETPEGKSVNAGEWRRRPDNLWELVIASPVVPAPEGEAWTEDAELERRQADYERGFRDGLAASPVVPKTADEIKAVVMAWLDADDPASWGDFEKRLNAAVSDDASPVVPVGSGESERKLVGQDYINAIKAHRVEHGSSLAVARNAVDCGWRPPAPVVPVGVSREEIARAVHRGRFPEDRKPTPFEAEDASGTTYCFRIADAIIAALRPTDTGWRDIATAPRDGTPVDLFLTYDPTNDTCKAFTGGRVTDAHYDNGWVAMSANPDGEDEYYEVEVLGIVTATHWMPLHPAPTDTGRE